ncbi:hypothetical protein CW702_02455 [Candidatus Bathyarchaeota archaeon]|nr:MAG: hypothetical protein CW702_02455 [Candidatus Bathyarchaeota archaeon]
MNKERGVTRQDMPYLSLFPYSPYPQQLEFMKDIYEVLRRERGVLVAEACNGFGKTACALAVALSLERKIVYATRTHEQVRQVLKEVETINLHANKNFSAICLASRRNLCLNEACRRLPPIEAMETCNILKKTGRCPYRWNINNLTVSSLPSVLSVRKLLKVGRISGVCPYFLARTLSSESTVVVAPYQYIFNEAIRIKVGLNLDDKILIFDEAHNADKIGQDVLSDTLSERGIRNARRELEALDLETEQIDCLHAYLEESIPDTDRSVVKSGLELKRDLEDVLKGEIVELLDYWEILVDEIRIYKIQRGLVPICYLNGLVNFLSLLISQNIDKYTAIFRLSKGGYKLIELRCLDPSLAIKPVIENAYGTVIMSGTLSPLDLYTEILGISNVRVRSYASIANPDNVMTFVDTSVTTRFKERTSRMLDMYGERIYMITSKVKNGILVFFPQREFMMDALRKWISGGLIKSMGRFLTIHGRRIFIEGEDASENSRIVEEYKKAAKSEEGAILFAVFRGRNAEGSNFPYEEANAIILVGLPYADYHDPAVKAQIAYLNSKSPRLGERWYVMDAFRAANQALGRGIRHRDDWCTFFLLDRRYGTHWRFISRWARENGILPFDKFFNLNFKF